MISLLLLLYLGAQQPVVSPPKAYTGISITQTGKCVTNCEAEYHYIVVPKTHATPEPADEGKQYYYGPQDQPSRIACVESVETDGIIAGIWSSKCLPLPPSVTGIQQVGKSADTPKPNKPTPKKESPATTMYPMVGESMTTPGVFYCTTDTRDGIIPCPPVAHLDPKAPNTDTNASICAPNKLFTPADAIVLSDDRDSKVVNKDEQCDPWASEISTYSTISLNAVIVYGGDGSKVIKLSDEEYKHYMSMWQAVEDEEKRLAAKYGADLGYLNMPCPPNYGCMNNGIPNRAPDHFEFHGKFLLIEKGK